MRIAFIGGGNMARAIVGGLISKGMQPAEFLVVDVDVIARSKLAAQFGVEVAESLDKVAHADVVVFAVKPQQMREAAERVAQHAGEALFITIAAGIRLQDLGRWLGGRTRLIRAMPNTPAMVHAGVTGLYGPPDMADVDRKAAEVLLGAVGATLWFERESDLDVVTAVSGSGPAYVFYAIEALEHAARELGLGDGAARTLALWTFVGATKLAIERGEEPAKLRAQVTSKGGTTERAVEVLDAAQVRAHFVEAVKAACARSRELGDAFGKD
jgi:pyrroline-5-carboxylate reductase